MPENNVVNDEVPDHLGDEKEKGIMTEAEAVGGGAVKEKEEENGQSHAYNLEISRAEIIKKLRARIMVQDEAIEIMQKLRARVDEQEVLISMLRDENTKLCTG